MTKTQLQKCNLCNLDKSLEMFRFKDGYLLGRCKECENKLSLEYFYLNYPKNIKRQEQYRESHRIEINENARLNYQNNKALLLKKDKEYHTSLYGKFVRWKRRANKANIEWEIDFDYIKEIPMMCFYTNDILTLELGNFNTVSLDRINSKLGYTEKNTVFCCSGLNIMKNTVDLETFIFLCESVTTNSGLKKVDNLTLKDIIPNKGSYPNVSLNKRIYGWKRSASKRNILWNIDDSFIESLSSNCYYTGIELSPISNLFNTVSLDRIDSSLDYTLNNLVPCCSYINKIKNKFSTQKFIDICKTIFLRKNEILRGIHEKNI